jgi:hypothetical protein
MGVSGQDELADNRLVRRAGPVRRCSTSAIPHISRSPSSNGSSSTDGESVAYKGIGAGVASGEDAEYEIRRVQEPVGGAVMRIPEVDGDGLRSRRRSNRIVSLNTPFRIGF